MNIQLSSDAEQIVNEKIASGEFTSPEAVVSAALEAFVQESEEELERLRAAVAIGIAEADAGLLVPWDGDKYRRRILASAGRTTDEDRVL